MNIDKRNEQSTKLVVFLTAITMVVEIIFGITTKSMALLADGIHMASHVGALGITWLAYGLIRKNAHNPKFKSGTGKILALSGFTNGIILQVFAIIILVESIKRLMNPVEINFRDAIIVALIGFVVNLVSSKILHRGHKDSDHNIKAAYLHVIADALTSLTAIVALFAAMYWKINSLDVIGGIIGSIVITKWSIGLLKTTGLELLDYSSKEKE